MEDETDGTSAEKKNKGGRPPHEPDGATRQLIEQLSAFGTPHEAIAKIVGISEPTMRKHYADELELGGHKASAKIANGLFKKALEGDVACMIFWLKTRAGWRETQKLEHSGPDGKPLAAPPTLADFVATMAAFNGKGNRVKGQGEAQAEDDQG